MQAQIIEELPRHKRKNLAAHASKNPKQFRVDRSDLKLLATEARHIFKQFPSSLQQPQPKVAPELSLTQIADICGTTRTVMKNRMSPAQLSRGRVAGSDGRELIFSCADARELIAETGIYPRRQKTAQGKVIVLGSHVADSGKTTAAVALAQGLALRGMKVLLVDLDVQAAATNQLGASSLVEPAEYDYIAFELVASKPDFSRFARPTYWPGLDLVASTPSLICAGMYLDNKLRTAIQKGSGWDKFGCVTAGLTQSKMTYDVIIIDTASSTDLLTQAATFAADILLSPVKPTHHGFAAAIDYLQLYDDLVFQVTDVVPELMNAVERVTAELLAQKRFDLIELIETNADSSNRQHALVGALLQDAFPRNMCPVSLPLSERPSDPFATGIEKLVDHIAAELLIAWQPSPPVVQ